MNKHFRDSLYYLERAGEHAKLGVEATLDPVVARFRALVGREPEPEPSRIETVVENVRAFEERAEAEAREAIDGARDRVGSSRP